jgi:hypothetical protein
VVQQFQILNSHLSYASSPDPFQTPCYVAVLECVSLVMSLSAREKRARANRIASNDRLIKHKARDRDKKTNSKHASVRKEGRESCKRVQKARGTRVCVCQVSLS